MTAEPARFFASSASDKTDYWPFWFVADRKKGCCNVTAELIRALIDPMAGGNVFLRRENAVALAERANAASVAVLP